MNLGTTGHDDYNAYLTEECKRELNHVPTVLEQLRDVWDGYDIQETNYSEGGTEYNIFKDYEHFNFDCTDKTWWAYDGEDVCTITIQHMDMICETGQILGWW